MTQPFRMLEDVDSNSDGTIDWEEFKAWVLND